MRYKIIVGKIGIVGEYGLVAHGREARELCEMCRILG